MPLAVTLVRGKDGRAGLRASLAALVGPLGSLPPAYNEHIMREERNRSGALAAFLDLFASRMAELFVDACEKYRLARLLRWGAANRNAFTTALFSLSGFGTARLRERSGVADDVLLRFSGFFSARTRNTVNLRAMLREFTGMPVEIELFRGRWLTVPEAERSRMSADRLPRLGVDAMAGSLIHDFSGGFRVVVGPLSYADYISLTPGGRKAADLFALTRLFAGTGLDFDVQVVLKKEDIPFCRLGGEAPAPQLGWNSWARTTPPTRDSGDAIITQSAMSRHPAGLEDA